MESKFLESSKGQDRLILDGFIFYRERNHNDRTYWKCSEYKTKSCSARAITNGIDVVNSTVHNHAANPAFVSKEKVVHNMKKEVKETDSSLQRIIVNNTGTIPDAVAVNLPRFESLKRTLRGVRGKEKYFSDLLNPATREEFIIPLERFKTKRNKPFIMFDSGNEEERIIILTTSRNLRLLASTDDWFGDGTFGACPSLFEQLYSIHSIIDNSVIPLVYGLLPGKSTEIYKKFLQALKRLNKDLNPTSILIDLELGMGNAMEEEFPNVTIRYCYFHYCQAVYRKVCDYGLKSNYDEDIYFCEKVKLLMALAYVPSDHVESVFDDIVNQYFTDQQANIQEFIFSFEKQYIGRVDRRGNRLLPRYPIHLWNQYEAVQRNLPRTNNHVEGWHRAFNELLKCKKPTIWKLFDTLIDEQSRTDLRIVQIQNQVSPEPPSKKIKKVTDRLVKITTRYNDRILYPTKLEYVKAISHCVSI